MPNPKANPVNSTSWVTPAWLFNFLNDIYSFDLDAAASDKNRKCAKFFTEDNNALDKKWTGQVWVNPPYSNKTGNSTTDWVKYGHDQVVAGNANAVCLLIPLKPDTSMYHDYIRKGQLVKEYRFEDPRGKVGIGQIRDAGDIFVNTYEFRGRIPFTDDHGNVAGNGWFASVAVVFSRKLNES